MTATVIGVPPFLEHAGGYEGFEARTQSVGGYPEGRFKLVERSLTEKGLANDQHRPALPHDLQSPSDGTILRFVFLRKHNVTIQVGGTWV